MNFMSGPQDSGFMQALFSRYNQNPGGLGSGTFGMGGGSADVPSVTVPGTPLGAPKPMPAMPNPTGWTSGFDVPSMDGAGAGYNAAMGGAAKAGAEPSWMDQLLGYKRPDGSSVNGLGGLAVGVASSLLNGWMGMQQYGLAKKQLNEGQRRFDMSYDAEKRTTNSALEDRQRARIASNPGAYESISSYMDKNGIR